MLLKKLQIKKNSFKKGEIWINLYVKIWLLWQWKMTGNDSWNIKISARDEWTSTENFSIGRAHDRFKFLQKTLEGDEVESTPPLYVRGLTLLS